MKKLLKKIIPNFIFDWYHLSLAFLGAIICGFPSRKIFVLGVTGTKGKTSILEIISAGLEEAGYKTALMSTLRFKIGEKSRRNKLKMTMPGRFFVQKFLRSAVKKGCQYALIEATSQGVLQSRHKFIEFDAMVFSNLAPEHIESHGSFEKYREAKMELFGALERSSKKKRISIINIDDGNASYFLRFKTDETWFFGLKPESFARYPLKSKINMLKPANYEVSDDGIKFTVVGKNFKSPLRGEFNLYNMLAAVAFLKSQNIGWETIKNILDKFSDIPGRLEEIHEGQNFKVIVDYAHTPDSLKKVYEVFLRSRKICVLGSAGGGRDKWKRKEMGKIADNFCEKIILTNEDPYDENPEKIIENIAEGIAGKHENIIDRREAIKKALSLAKAGDVVLITGKGTDPYIMGPGGARIPWDDREVVREELSKILDK